ncbi:MAG: hypothetical protein KAT93_02630 [Desulfuromonadales bacterium]|nr:hypothetical protein [Desulfuromonadales bacterium]
MACREKGMALATVIFVLALLMVLALVLTDKVLKATRGTAAANAREQALSAANAGIEWGRRQLAATYASSDRWRSYLSQASEDLRYPSVPSLTTSTNGLQVDIFLRDNPDGDGDWQCDNDLRIFMLARARTPLGAETIVETLCGFAATQTTTGYRQLAPGSADAGPGLDPGSAAEFHMTD